MLFQTACRVKPECDVFLSNFSNTWPCFALVPRNLSLITLTLSSVCFEFVPAASWAVIYQQLPVYITEYNIDVKLEVSCVQAYWRGFIETDFEHRWTMELSSHCAGGMADANQSLMKQCVCVVDGACTLSTSLRWVCVRCVQYLLFTSLWLTNWHLLMTAFWDAVFFFPIRL